MKYVLYDEARGCYVAMAKKVEKVGYTHLYDICVEYTFLLREAQQFSKKEADKWSERIGHVVLHEV